MNDQIDDLGKTRAKIEKQKSLVSDISKAELDIDQVEKDLEKIKS